MEQRGGQCFLSAFQLNKTLTTLKLQGNSISNDILTAVGKLVSYLISSLMNSTTNGNQCERKYVVYIYVVTANLKNQKSLK